MASGVFQTSPQPSNAKENIMGAVKQHWMLIALVAVVVWFVVLKKG